MDVIEVVPFAAARVQELHEIHVASGYEQSSNTRIRKSRKDFHLRRRANAYKSHKFPARFRVKPRAKQSATGVEERCRKHRRRAMLRQKSDRLATHQWHAKRMKMGKVDGIWVSLHRLDRGTAAALLAPSTVCDTSYLSVIDVHGPKEDVLEALDSILDESLTDDVLHGDVEGASMLYHADAFPMNAIGPARVMCKRSRDEDSSSLHVWLWTYPSMVPPLLSTLASLDSHNVCVQRRADLCRFELRGPQAPRVMTRVFQSHDRLRWTTNQTLETSRIQSWQFTDPRTQPKARKNTGMSSLVDAPPASVPDPACPVTKAKLPPTDELTVAALNARFASVLRWATEQGTGYSQLVSPTPPDPLAVPTPQPADANNATDSILWDATAMPPPFVHDHIVNQPPRRHNNPSDAAVPSFPSITVQNALGWDVIVHANMAPTVLKALVFAGASAIGMDERQALRTRHHLLNFPRDYPDTGAGREFWEAVRREKEAKHTATPKAKRTPFHALQVASPFAPDWRLLFSNDLTDFCVLRGAEFMEPFPFYNPSAKQDLAMVPTAMSTLICVQVALPRRGTVEDNAMICFPTERDVAEFERDDRWQGEMELTAKQAKKRSDEIEVRDDIHKRKGLRDIGPVDAIGDGFRHFRRACAGVAARRRIL
ncbi:hypothetical protein, variant [Aphanomyces astaci]|uniref:Pop1 N-terminal domain-containing protein n=1 Tax=Aphanomyces astaci TaxID=112090 RepID=W4H7X2_APHAT|nr:hypothetical protein, variant [Aphanomyces astaci]ETV88105.1 hypothetical protein, variant [Aphanomyces astaci]|eukprot:XP_009822968.1 hypothetical protein, variant [Aphanomyces astaci]